MSLPGPLGSYEGTPGQWCLGAPAQLGDLIEASPGCVAHFRLDEVQFGASYPLIDSLGSHTGTYAGSPASYGGGAALRSVQFPTASDYAVAGGPINVATGSVEGWFRLVALPGSAAVLFGCAGSAAQQDKVVYLDAAGQICFAVNDGTAKVVPSGVTATANRWYHVVGSFDGSNATIYVNGVQVAQVACGNTLVGYTGNNFVIAGGATGYAACPGIYDEIAVYSTPLTARMVADHYSLGQGSITDTYVRVTQEVAEVLRNGLPNARVTQLALEVARNGEPNARVTQFAVEVLRSTAVGNSLSVGATTALTLSAGALTGAAHAVSARGGIGFLDAGSGHYAYVAAAATTLKLSGFGRAPKDGAGVAASGVRLASSARDIGNPNVPASAATGVALAAAAAPIVSHSVNASAATAILLSQSASESHAAVVAASSSVRFASYSTVHNTDVQAGATTGIVLSVSAFESDPQAYPVVAATGVLLAPTAGGRIPLAPSVSAGTTVYIQGDTFQGYVTPIRVSASSAFDFADTGSESGEILWPVSASSAFLVSPVPIVSGQLFALGVDAATTVALDDGAGAGSNQSVLVSASVVVTLEDAPTETRTGVAASSTAIVLSPSAASGGRDLAVSAVTSVGFGEAQGTNQLAIVAALSGIRLSASAAGSVSATLATAGLVLAQRADAIVALPSGGGVPGGDQNSGLATVLSAGVSGDFPMSFAETPAGLLMIANGVDPMIRWDGLSATADSAGVQPPATGIALGGQGVGTITGVRMAYCRFLDAAGNPSNLSPVSNPVNMGRDALIDLISYDQYGRVTVQSAAHGLTTSDQVVIQGVRGLPGVNGTWTVLPTDADHFLIAGLAVTSGQYAGGGSWTWGVAQVVYQRVPTPVESKVVRRQILRNLDGNADVFYVDIDTTDLASSLFISTRTDEDLSAQEPVPLADEDDLPYANRHGVPPSHKAVVASHLGRIFAATDVTVTAGHVQPVFGSATVVGVGTDWKANFAGRLLYVSGATKSYEIAAVDPIAQVITLTATYADATARFAPYAIRSAPAERKLVYYSEPALPDSWPPWDALPVPEDSDDITGLMVKGSFLYVLERRHIYRLTSQGDPAEGNLFLSVMRGALNNRVVVQVEDNAYMLDEVGVHAFDGGQKSTPISQPIQTIFQQDSVSGGMQIDWTADQTLWHAAHDPVRDTIRWFVAMVGAEPLTTAICYDYRQERWWIEAYPSPITSSATGTVGYRRSLAGTDGRRVLVLSEGTLDCVDGDVSYRGTATAADATSLTDTAASFPANLEGAPVSIVSGTGRGQQRIICDNTADSLSIVEPWDEGGVPDATSVYQVGGVPWRWRSGWMQFVADEQENVRDVEIVFQPLAGPATLDLQLFYDHAATPRDWAWTDTRDGVTVWDGQPYLQMDLDSPQGFVFQRLQGHSEEYAFGDRFLSVMLSGVQAGELVRVYQVNVSGVATGEAL